MTNFLQKLVICAVLFPAALLALALFLYWPMAVFGPASLFQIVWIGSILIFVVAFAWHDEGKK